MLPPLSRRSFLKIGGSPVLLPPLFPALTLRKVFLLANIAAALLLVAALAGCSSPTVDRASTLEGVHIRINQLGYLPDDAKVAVVLSAAPIDGSFQVVDAATGAVRFYGQAETPAAPGWHARAHFASLDFSAFAAPGRYYLEIQPGGHSSSVFSIGEDSFGDAHEELLGFMRQQRCGFNPFLDKACHQLDGRTMYGPMPDSTHIDVTGGWHDAGDQLKYLITASNATARMILAYELEPGKFGDRFDARGRPGANGIPDVLDEARWGLDWIRRLHPRYDQLFHQVADDRDHIGWKWPDRDSSDYGWGPNSYRVVYFANGKPQGLREFKSQATGIANLAGRSAAAMAMASRVWRETLHDEAFADSCLHAARTLYALGRSNEGYQQGNSYGAPYRYNEDTWTDDMEWGAAELFKATGDRAYLDDAGRYALMAGATSWMQHDSTDHYRFYPFLNAGHFALYPHAAPAIQDSLASFYRQGIERILSRGQHNVYGVGVPFIWCSNNLMTAFITQVLLYERMTGDRRYHAGMIAHRDWLLGRNPWGTSMFTNIPADGEFPEDIHTSIWALTRQPTPGGLVDGPVFVSIFRSLRGLRLNEPDEFAAFQNDFVVYHDDIGDYSTNEPTMDGTAGAIYMMAHFGKLED